MYNKMIEFIRVARTLRENDKLKQIKFYVALS